MSRDYDAIVIGAGPAGCAAARLLASWGHRILLLHRPEPDSRTLAESIPPSAQRVLATLGVLTSMEDAGFLPWLGNMVWWANADCRIESFMPGQSGYLVDRRAFDRRLQRLAAEAGAHLRTGIVRSVEVAPEIKVEVNGELQTLRSAFVLDCSGRAGVIARRGMRELLPSPRTVALVGAWRARDRWPEASDAHTLVASYADGWAWSVPTEPGLRYFTVMIEPGLTGLADGSAGDRYVAELAKIPPFRKLLDRATPAGGPWGADASVYTSRTFAGPGFLLVGDAGSFIDPLSSFGVKKALVSGWLAAITVHTALTNAGMRREALQFFDRRERQMAAGWRQPSGQFAADAAAGMQHPFWVGRAAVSHDSAGLGDELDPAALARDPSVLAAFEDLRRRENLHVTPGSRARLEPRPMVRGREIVLEDQLLVPPCPDGIRYLRGIDLVELGRLAPQFTDVGQMYEAQRRAQPDIALPDFLGALSVLIAWDVLQHPPG
jgi:FADH2-dependent halogenase/halogenation protein CepH